MDIFKLDDIKEKRLWEKSIFVFDSSALLDLYFLPKSTREKVYSEIFKNLKNRLWIPSHVKYEYHKNKDKVIAKPISEDYKPLEDDIKSIKNEIENKIKNKLTSIINLTKKDDKHPHLKQDELLKFQKEVDNFLTLNKKFEDIILNDIKIVKEEILNVKNEDDVLNAINKYFKVGRNFTFNEIIEITKEGKHRFEYKIPPGYGDYYKKEKKGTQIFADLIIWKQIIEYSKEKQLPIIFITNDITKDDDWCYVDQKKKDRIASPREELIKEIYDHSNIEFWMYSQTQFLYLANKYLESTIEDKIINNMSKLLISNHLDILELKYIEIIFNNIKTMQTSSKEIKDYINSLNKKEYALLATTFIIGRSGWERNYYDTTEYYSFVENNEFSGIKVNQKMLDDEFLTNNIKKEQVQLTYDYELSSSEKFDGVYNHNWLGMKTNLITEVYKGFVMFQGIK